MPLLGRRSRTEDARESAYRQWVRRQHPLAMASVILSVFSLTHFGTLWLDEIAAIVLGIVALRQLTRRRPTEQLTDGGESAEPRAGGRSLAWAGIVVGVASLACAVLIYFVVKPRR